MAGNKTANKRVTLAMVAQEAEVSRMAAYAVLNPDKRSTIGVGKEAEARIKAASAKLGYIPNHAARSLVSGKTNTVGFLLPRPGDAFDYQITKFLHRVFSRYNYAIHFEYHDYDPQKERVGLEIMMSRAVDGLFVSRCGWDCNSDMIQRFVDCAVPVIVLGEEYVDSQLVYISTVSRRQWGMLLAHFQELDWRDFYAVYPAGWGWSTERRLANMCDAFQDNPQLTLHAHAEVDSYASCLEQMRKWFGGSTVRQGLLCHNDRMAEVAIYCLRELGIAVPGQVGVAGYDGLEDALRPLSITSISFPMANYAETCYQAFISVLENRVKNNIFVVDSNILIRQSTTGIAR